MSEESILTLSVEQFMDAIRGIIESAGIEVPESVDPILVDSYNECRQKALEGQEVDDAFFIEIAKKIVNELEGVEWQD